MGQDLIVERILNLKRGASGYRVIEPGAISDQGGPARRVAIDGPYLVLKVADARRGRDLVFIGSFYFVTTQLFEDIIFKVTKDCRVSFEIIIIDPFGEFIRPPVDAIEEEVNPAAMRARVSHEAVGGPEPAFSAVGCGLGVYRPVEGIWSQWSDTAVLGPGILRGVLESEACESESRRIVK